MYPTQETLGNEQRQSLVVLLDPTSKRRHTVADSPQIDPEFKALIPPLSSSEFATLEASILEEVRSGKAVPRRGQKIKWSK